MFLDFFVIVFGVLQKNQQKIKFSEQIQNFWISLWLFLDFSWITRPERRLKGVKDEVKQARRAATQKLGPGPEGSLNF